VKDFSGDIAATRRRLEEAHRYLRVEQLRGRLAELEKEASRPDLWDKPDAARRVTTEMSRVRDDLELYDDLLRRLDDAETLWELGREEGDDSVEAEIEAGLASAASALNDLELRSLFSGEYDEGDTVCEVHSGAGGTDSQDWAEMLFRMYTRWAERRGFDIEVDEWQEGQEAGITSATFIVRGRYAYGLLSAERGVHRLVRISPFDAQARRHTAFASFEAIPFIEEAESEIDIDEKDLRVDTYRSSGAGGQHVNVTDSAVRLTHLPTGLVVACQNERSQHQNKARAMQLLAMKLAERRRQERQAELDALTGDQRDVAWGNQIRSYVLQPYQQVKDLRTELEVGNVEGVLDGDLDPFIEAFLQWRRASEVAAAGDSGVTE
jgi:peptide chain release factor 2